MAESSKPRVLVLGGVGFVGRHLVKYLVDNELASKIRVIDKQLPATSYFHSVHLAAFASPIVEAKQGDLTRQATVTRLFVDETGPFDIIVNLAAETKYGMEDEVYKQKCYDLSVLCATEAAKLPIRRYIEVSTAHVYAPDSKISKETSKIAPWTKQATWKYKAEDSIRAIPGLPLVVLRPALIYGPGDLSALTPRIVVAAAYKVLREKMKLLWDSSLRINTVHVDDVVRAIWLAATSGSPGAVYNLADKSDLDQGKFNQILKNIFRIETGFHGKMISSVAKVALSHVCDEANEKHSRPWADVCREVNLNTPLTPFIDKELLYNNSLYIDGTAVEQQLGFAYTVPEISEDRIREQIQFFVSQNLFPASLLEA
eukprot:GILJ01003755.1.p1 GENE.GILJ01003755.1~~GILJ01003755.1.p1  ORF type:complete len:389 (+),score=54.05 GILJ01003755.1:57-1169(+)